MTTIAWGMGLGSLAFASPAGGPGSRTWGFSKSFKQIRSPLLMTVPDVALPAATGAYTVATFIGGSRPHLPHLRLMRAVLDDAVSIVVFGRVRESVTLRSETINWVLADDTQSIFSYRNACEALDVDAERLRARLAPWLSLGPRLRRTASSRSSRG